MIFTAGYTGWKWPGIFWCLASFVLFLCGLFIQFPINTLQGFYLHLYLSETGRFAWVASLVLMLLPLWRNFKGGGFWFFLPLSSSVLLSLPIIWSGAAHHKFNLEHRFSFGDWFFARQHESGFLPYHHLDAPQRISLVYLPDKKIEAPPIVFLFHGGGFIQGSPAQMHAWSAAFSRAGCLVVAAAYPLGKEAQFPNPENSAAALIKSMMTFLHERGGDTNKVFVGGSSAGATLALSMAVQHPQLNLSGIIAAYPLSDFSNNSNPLLRLEDIKAAYAGNVNAASLSLAHRMKSPLPPLLLLHGAKDQIVPVAQSRMLNNVYQGPHAYVEMPYSNHNFEYPLFGPSGQLLHHLSIAFIRNPNTLIGSLHQAHR
ncbi:MAG: alpha/beta hydrolase [Bacteroidia bacterium]